MTDSIQVLKPGWRALDANGDVLSGAVLSFFDAGTSNTRTVYSNYGLSAALGVTVTCDSGGFPTSDGNTKVEIYTGASPYKVVLKNSAGTTQWTLDNVVGALDTSPFAAATFAKPDTDCAADTANTTLTTDDLGTVRNGNPTGGTFTYTLPSAITATNGRGYTVRHVGTANQILVDTVSGQTIDGLTSKTIAGRYESLTLVSDGANWHVQQDANRTVVGGTIEPQGYLTLLGTGSDALNYFPTADIAAATAVYYRPTEHGNLVPIYDGTRFVLYEFDELTLTLASQHTGSAIFDVFAFLNNNTVTIGTGPAWATATAGSGARGTGAGTTQLTRIKGLPLNTVAMTARNSATTYSLAAQRATYLGSLLIDSSAGQITCHTAYGQSRKWGVWNAYNRLPLHLKAGESTASWNYASATWRASNGASANSLTVLTGLADVVADLRHVQKILVVTSASQTSAYLNGIGLNSTTATSGLTGEIRIAINAASDARATAVAAHLAAVGIGANTVTALESASANNLSNLYYGTEANQLLSARWMG